MAARKTTVATRSKSIKPTPIEETVTNTPTPPAEEKVVKKEVEKKKFNSNDGIKCTSITSGGLYMIGIKTGILYSWVDSGDSIDVEYADLVAEVRTRGMYAFRPRFIVEDQDFIDEFPELDTLYASLYTKKDMKEILSLDASRMRQVVVNLPDGAKDSIKSMAVTAIERGELDSIAKIKIIDEIFGTNLLLKMTS